MKTLSFCFEHEIVCGKSDQTDLPNLSAPAAYPTQTQQYEHCNNNFCHLCSCVLTIQPLLGAWEEARKVKDDDNSIKLCKCFRAIMLFFFLKIYLY